MTKINDIIAEKIILESKKSGISDGMREALVKYADKARKLKVDLTDSSQLRAGTKKTGPMIDRIIQETTANSDSSSSSSSGSEPEYEIEEIKTYYKVSEEEAINLARKGVEVGKIEPTEVAKLTRNYSFFEGDFEDSLISHGDIKYLDKEVARKLFDEETFFFTGPYRRKEKSPGMINVIIKRGKKPGRNLTQFVNGLVDNCYLSKRYFIHTNSLYEGAVKIKEESLYRHIRIEEIDANNWGTYTLMKTGDDYFVAKFLKYTKKMGYDYDNFIFSKTSKDRKGNKTRKVIVFSSEEELFTYFNLEYVEPRNRVEGSFLLVNLSS
jgi:hypothetical protein